MKYYKILFLILLSFPAFSQDSILAISGINYSGKNLYIQNPLSAENELCVLQVWLNNSLVISSSTSSAIEVPVNDIPVNDSLYIKIVHRNSCQPKIVNLSILFEYPGRISAFEVSEDSLKWSKTETVDGDFYVEEYLNNRWQEILTVRAGLDTAYSVPVNHRGSINYYRIKFKSYQGMMMYSEVVSYGKEPEQELQLYCVGNCIYFDKVEDYSITLIHLIIKQGRADHVCLENLSSGVYYISVGNQTKKFFRK